MQFVYILYLVANFGSGPEHFRVVGVFRDAWVCEEASRYIEVEKTWITFRCQKEIVH